MKIRASGWDLDDPKLGGRGIDADQVREGAADVDADAERVWCGGIAWHTMAVRAIFMHSKTTHGTLIGSLLAAVLTCNAALLATLRAEAPVPSSAVATAPHRDPAFHVDMKRSVEFLAS